MAFIFRFLSHLIAKPLFSHSLSSNAILQHKLPGRTDAVSQQKFISLANLLEAELMNLTKSEVPKLFIRSGLTTYNCTELVTLFLMILSGGLLKFTRS